MFSPNGKKTRKRKRIIDCAKFLGRQNSTGSRTQEEALFLNRSRDHSVPVGGKEKKMLMAIFGQFP